MTHLIALVKNAFTKDELKFRQQHTILEDKYSAFVKDFKSLKRDIFKTTEKIIKTEKLKRLLTRKEN
jgi:hypothetical protein